MSFHKTKKYNLFLNYIRSCGVSVRHCRLPSETNGVYNAENESIQISPHIRGTIHGCYTLLHEYGHYISDIRNLFPSFMRGYGKYKPKYMKEIIAAEEYAAKFALRMMKGVGLKYLPIELDHKEREQLLEYWRNWYFDN